MRCNRYGDWSGVLPLLHPWAIYPVVQGLVMELAADLWHSPEPLSSYPKHSSLAHHKESGQADSEIQDSVAWGPKVGTADPENLIHHQHSKFYPYLRHCFQVQMPDEEQELPDCILSQYSLHISDMISYTILYTMSYTISWMLLAIFYKVMLQRMYICTGKQLQYRRSETYDIAYDIVNQNLYRRENRKFRRFLTVCSHSYLWYYLLYSR